MHNSRSIHPCLAALGVAGLLLTACRPNPEASFGYEDDAADDPPAAAPSGGGTDAAIDGDTSDGDTSPPPTANGSDAAPETAEPAGQAKPAEEAEEDSPGEGKPTVVRLSRARVFNLDVEQVDEDVYIALILEWSFEDAIPAELLSTIKRHPRHSKAKDDNLGVAASANESALQAESGYIRWEPPEKGGAGAVLLYSEGEKRHELAISVDLFIKHAELEDAGERELSWDDLAVSVDLSEARIASARLNDKEMPPGGKANVRARVSGRLSEESAARLQSADKLLGDEITAALMEAARMTFSNDSHHGITLGWLGYDQLIHQLLIVPGETETETFFRWTVTGEPFPLVKVQRQLSDLGWPLVLRGEQLLGVGEDDGTYVMQPVEFRLYREERP